MGSWIIEIPFIVILLKLAIYLAGRTSNILKSALGVAALYAIPKTFLMLLFSNEVVEVMAVIVIGVIELIAAFVYFFLVLKLYDRGFIWWTVTLLGALVFLFTNL